MKLNELDLDWVVSDEEARLLIDGKWEPSGDLSYLGLFRDSFVILPHYVRLYCDAWNRRYDVTFTETGNVRSYMMDEYNWSLYRSHYTRIPPAEEFIVEYAVAERLERR